MSAKKPTALKLLQGTYDKSRAVENEPVYDAPATTEAPEHFDGLALLKWNELAPLLTKTGVLTETDLHNLEAFCLAYQQFRLAQRLIDQEGFVVDSAGGVKKNPAVTVSHEAQRNMLSFGAALGLDPASRTKINGKPEQKKANPFDKKK